MKRQFSSSPDEVADPSGGDLAEARRYNPPGQRSLVYRAGTYSAFLERMLDRARAVTVSDGPNRGNRPLAHLNVAASHDLAVSLFQAWAVVGDVLTFYQERIANEGFLRTAVEHRSVLELVRTMNVELRPGVAARTYLAFTLIGIPGAPTRALIPAGTSVRSTPDSDRAPPTFETSADLPARLEWNALSSYVPTISRSPELTDGATDLQIAATPPGPRIGSTIVVVRSDPSGAPLGVDVRVVKTIQVDHAAGYTRLGWDEPLERLLFGAAAPRSEVFLPRQRAALFGHDAPDWASVPDTTRATYATRTGGLLCSADRGASWQARNAGLHDVTISAIVDDGRGSLFLGSDVGVYRSVDGGQTWLATLNGLGKKSVLALIATAAGYLYASTATGEVFRSTDRGGTWESLRGGATLVQSGRYWTPRNGRLPRTIIRTIAAVGRPDADHDRLFVGTDRGVLHSANGGSTWTTANAGLPGFDPGSGTAQTVVHALVADSDGVTLFAGTDHGVFVRKSNGRTWSPASAGLPNVVEPARGMVSTVVDRLRRVPSSVTIVPPGVVVYALATLPLPRPAQPFLLAGTDHGVYLSSDRGRRWQSANRGFPVSGDSAAPFVVRSLAVTIDPATQEVRVVAGTNGGVFASDDRGASWRPLVGGDASTVAVDRTGALWAATPLGGYLETEWPRFHLQRGQIDLDRVYSQLVSGGWAVLRQDAPVALVGAYPIADVVTTTRADFSRHATISRIVTTADDRLAQFDLRQTTAYVDAERLDPWEERIPLVEPVQGDQLRLNGVDLDLPVGGWIGISGKRLRGGERASAGDAPIGEIGQIRAVEESTVQGYTTITLAERLRDSYDPTTVSVCANVVASHASDIGVAGNVEANRLTLLPTRPPGVRSVTNPVSAIGGADPDSADLARSRATPQIRSLQRIISLGDFEDFARAFAGIGKAQARQLRNGKDKLVYLTVAATDGGPVPADGELHQALIEAIDGCRVATQPVQIASYERRLFDVEATIQVDPNADADRVVATVRSGLLAAFSFDRRCFGQDVRTSELIALIQNVPGVVAVRLDALFLHGGQRDRHAVVAARDGEWGPAGPRPAQLLLLNGVGGLTLAVHSL